MNRQFVYFLNHLNIFAVLILTLLFSACVSMCVKVYVHVYARAYVCVYIWVFEVERDIFPSQSRVHEGSMHKSLHSAPHLFQIKNLFIFLLIATPFLTPFEVSLDSVQNPFGLPLESLLTPY